MNYMEIFVVINIIFNIRLDMMQYKNLINKLMKIVILCITLFTITSASKFVLIGGGLNDNNTKIYNAFISLAS